MLRITDLGGRGHGDGLKVEGRIDGSQVEELARAVARSFQASDRVLLDLSGVTSIDRAGVELLHVLRTRGVELRNCSAFIETLVTGART